MMPQLPLPNERLENGELVIASVWGNDGDNDADIPIWALLLTLANEPPYYRVREIVADDDKWMIDGESTVWTEWPNIVPAVAAYVEAGGDY